MAKITVDGRLSALDMRLIGRRNADNPASKINHVVSGNVTNQLHQLGDATHAARPRQLNDEMNRIDDGVTNAWGG